LEDVNDVCVEYPIERGTCGEENIEYACQGG